MYECVCANSCLQVSSSGKWDKSHCCSHKSNGHTASVHVAAGSPLVPANKAQVCVHVLKECGFERVDPQPILVLGPIPALHLCGGQSSLQHSEGLGHKTCSLQSVDKHVGQPFTKAGTLARSSLRRKALLLPQLSGEGQQQWQGRGGRLGLSATGERQCSPDCGQASPGGG